MRSIVIHTHAKTDVDMAEMLARIASLIEQGSTSGVEPHWTIVGDEEEDEEWEEEEDERET